MVIIFAYHEIVELIHEVGGQIENIKMKIAIVSKFLLVRLACFSKLGSISDLHINYQGPVVQSIVSLMSLLVVKMLTVLVSTISNSQALLLKKYKHICHI